MGTYLIPVLSVSWVASSFGQWAPQTPRLSSDSALVTLESFWTVDSDVEGKVLLSGQLTIQNLSETAIHLGEVAIRYDGMILKALGSREVHQRLNLKEAAPLGLTRSQFLDRNIVGQEVLAKEEGSFMATFLASRNLPWKIELLLGDLGIVNLTNLHFLPFWSSPGPPSPAAPPPAGDAKH